MLELLFGVNYTPIQTKNLQFRKEICLKTQLLSKFIRVFQEIYITLEHKTHYNTS